MTYEDELDAEAVDHARLTIAQRVAADHEREGDTEMGDDTTRRDGWRDAQAATTVTGASPGDNPHPHDPEGKGFCGPAVPESRAERARDIGYQASVARDARQRKRGENPSQVTHPSNAMPGHPALTNVGTIHDSDAVPA